MFYRTQRRSRLVSLGLVGALFLAGACSSDNTGSTGGTTGSIALSLSPSSATLQAGSSTTVTGVLTRSGGYTGNVTVTATTNASGITGSVVTQPAGSNTATVTLTAAANATPGTDTITVTASGSGVTNATATFILTVVASNGQSFAGTLGTSAVALGVSGSVTDTLTLTRSNFTGAVTLSADTPLPNGVTVSFTQPSTTSTGVVTVNTSASATPGTYTILVRATGPGVSDVVFPLVVTVNSTTTTGGFTLSATPSAINLTAGSTSSTTVVNITRQSGFTGAVNFTSTLTGPGGITAPGGLTATLSPTSVTGTSSTLTVTATGSVPVGIYTLTITASGAGLTGGNQTLVIPITISAATGSAVRLDYSACSTGSTPVFVAYQDGTTGAWTKATATGGVYTFNVTNTKGAIAVVTQSGTSYNTTVLYMTQSELNTYTAACGVLANAKTVNGTFAGTGTGDLVTVGMGGSTKTVTATGTTGSFTLSNVSASTTDLFAYKRSVTAPGTGDKLIIRRDQNIANGGTIPVLDFSAAEAVTPTSANITVTGANTGDVLTQSSSIMSSANSCSASQFFGGLAVTNGQTTFPTYGIPAGSTRSTDYQSFTVTDVSGTSVRSTTVSTNTFGAQNIALGAALTAPTVTSLTGAAYKRLQATGSLPADYASVTFTYTDNVTGNSMTIIQSGNYLGGSAYTLVAPDLSALSGFNASWEPQTGNAASWFLSGSSALTGSLCTQGATLKTATISGTA